MVILFSELILLFEVSLFWVEVVDERIVIDFISLWLIAIGDVIFSFLGWKMCLRSRYCEERFRLIPAIFEVVLVTMGLMH